MTTEQRLIASCFGGGAATFACSNGKFHILFISFALFLATRGGFGDDKVETIRLGGGMWEGE